MTLPRRNSLVLPPQPPPAPIPPSLRQSPYLNAAIFAHDPSPPRCPNDADERWLRDTVPVQPEASAKAQDRRGSIVRPPSTPRSPAGRPLSYPASGPLTVDVNPPSPAAPSGSSSLTRGRSQTARYLSHSLAPPPGVDVPSLMSPCLSPKLTRPAQIVQTRSAPDILRVTADTAYHPQSDQDNSYFPPQWPHVR